MTDRDVSNYQEGQEEARLDQQREDQAKLLKQTEDLRSACDLSGLVPGRFIVGLLDLEGWLKMSAPRVPKRPGIEALKKLITPDDSRWKAPGTE